jgi:BlaI family penicillinase repressor
MPHMTTPNAKPKPTKLELTILRAMWQRGPGTVREIQETLNETRPTGYNTVLKMLQIMTEKGLVSRDESVRPQVFKARYSEEKTQQHLLRDLIQRAFNGSVKSLVMQALATKKASGKDLDTIEKLLDGFEGDKK